MKARHRGKLSRAIALVLLLVCAGLLLAVLPRCTRQHALLMTVTADAIVDRLDLRVKDLGTNRVVFERLGEKVDPNDDNRNISEPGKALKLAIEFEDAGHYLIFILGQGSETQVFIRDYQVDGVREEAAHLVRLQGHDKDGDGFPACGASELCQALACPYFDCDDSRQDIHPMAADQCGNGVDEDCSAGCVADPKLGDAPCVDNDGDGEPSSTDCNDGDPCLSHNIKEASTTCKTAPDAFKLPPACTQSMKPPYCGDGVDQDCNGQDAPCKVDEDCDDFSPPTDCDDKDAKINPKAQEECWNGTDMSGDGKDNNCNGVVDEGCVPCDVDGDGHALPGNKDPKCAVPKDETDDYDAGIHPATTKDTGGAEGGNVLGALRGWCSSKAGGEKNGKPAREVDHDGDKLPASQDGCPPANCDLDGDGFQGKQCNPPASQLDCDDNDPHTFPDAPEKCGDGKAQNCVSDGPCTCDIDKDGYCPPGDCNDADLNVLPWVADGCNGRDDDCDGLTDEANPDPAGNPLTVTQRTCNDDNEGFCGDCRWIDEPAPADPPRVCQNSRLLSGICVCSPADPGTRRDEAGNRVACGGEDLKAKASPRCFGARQPLARERCQVGDFDCKGGNIRMGEEFEDKGSACGITNGECVVGTVNDCNLDQSLAYLSLYKAVDPDFNPGWVCTLGTLPLPEVCNGRDDDCVAGVPQNEIDFDKDGYLPCANCPAQFSDGQKGLASGLTGCNDCLDSSAAVHPGAAETCNNVDDNCNSTTDDPPAGCGGATPTCCSVVKACKNLQNDFFHCGACNSGCATGVNDTCMNGSCGCGAGGACEAGQECVSGSCTCNSKSCKGCCENNHCRPGNTIPLCGVNGAACQNCNDSNVCTTDACTAGSCGHSNEPSTVQCQAGSVNGRCRSGSCCTGCWDGDSCEGGTSSTACGAGGITCGTCNLVGSCDTATCATGSCVRGNQPNGTTCPGPGLCYGGACCSGLYCWNTATSRCVATSNPTCGKDGANCTPCTAGICETVSCATGACVPTSLNSGSCTSAGGEQGTCLGGSCCTGCRDTSCRTGTANDRCGDDGIACVNCTTSSKICGPAQTCVCAGTDTACGTTTCVNCTTTNRTCDAQVCVCSGCMSGGNCVAGTDPAACGTSGNCSVCPPPPACKTATCPAGTCQTADKPPRTSCGTGSERCTSPPATCCATGCLTTSSPYTCQSGTVNPNCGKNGEDCKECKGSTPTCTAVTGGGQCQ